MPPLTRSLLLGLYLSRWLSFLLMTFFWAVLMPPSLCMILRACRSSIPRLMLGLRLISRLLLLIFIVSRDIDSSDAIFKRPFAASLASSLLSLSSALSPSLSHFLSMLPVGSEAATAAIARVRASLSVFAEVAGETAGSMFWSRRACQKNNKLVVSVVVSRMYCLVLFSPDGTPQ